MKTKNKLFICLIILCGGRLYGDHEERMWPWAQGEISENSKIELFMKSAFDGDITKVKELLDEGVNIDVQDMYGFTVLMHAALNNKFDMVLFLLERNANMYLEAKNLIRPLECAIVADSLEVLALLLYTGANDKSNEIRRRVFLEAATHWYAPKAFAMLLLHNPSLRYAKWLQSKQCIEGIDNPPIKAMHADFDGYLNEHPDFEQSVRTIMDNVRNDPRVIDLLRLKSIKSRSGGIIKYLRNREIGLNHFK